MKFAKLALVASLFAAFGAHAAGGLRATHTTNSVTINGTTYTAPSTASTPAIKSSYSAVVFDADTWTVSGGKFTAGTPAVTGASNADLATWVTTVNTAITKAISDEVVYVNSLVTSASTAIASYNSTATDSSTEDTAANGVTAKIDAVYSEVNSTRSAITELRTLNVRVDTVSEPDTIVIDNTRAVKNLVGTTTNGVTTYDNGTTSVTISSTNSVK